MVPRLLGEDVRRDEHAQTVVLKMSHDGDMSAEWQLNSGLKLQVE